MNLLADRGVTWPLHSHLPLTTDNKYFSPFTINTSSTQQALSMLQMWPVLLVRTLISNMTPLWPRCCSINGRCWVELGRIAPCVSSRYKYQSSDNKWCIRGKVKGFCFCVRPDNSLQTYLVLQQNVRVNLFQRQKKLRKWLNFLPSPTERLNTQKDITYAKVTAFTLQSAAPQVRSLVVAFPPRSLGRNMKSEIWRGRRGIGQRTINKVDCNLLQWRSQGSKAMSCWLFNKLQAYTAVWS